MVYHSVSQTFIDLFTTTVQSSKSVIIETKKSYVSFDLLYCISFNIIINIIKMSIITKINF